MSSLQTRFFNAIETLYQADFNCDSHSLTQLRKFAVGLISNANKMTRDELVAALNEAQERFMTELRWMTEVESTPDHDEEDEDDFTKTETYSSQEVYASHPTGVIVDYDELGHKFTVFGAYGRLDTSRRIFGLFDYEATIEDLKIRVSYGTAKRRIGFFEDDVLKKIKEQGLEGVVRSNYRWSNMKKDVILEFVDIDHNVLDSIEDTTLMKLGGSSPTLVTKIFDSILDNLTADK